MKHGEHEYPEGWTFFQWLSPKTIMVKRIDGPQFATFKKTSPEIMARMRKLEPLGYTSKVYWDDGQHSLLEWIEGENWKIYLDHVPLTKELAEWYILENWKIHKLTGGHGDFVWYNVMITPQKTIKWIDIGGNGDDVDSFVNQIWMHTYRIFSLEYIYSLIGE